jgi:hypothetical protein
MRNIRSDKTPVELFCVLCAEISGVSVNTSSPKLLFKITLDHFALGMNPGTPVFTTALNLTRDLIPSLISRTASSGMAETSKFSRMRLGVFEVVRGSRPALDSPGEQHLGRGLLDSLGDSSDDRVFQQIGLAAMTQGSESLQHDALLSAIIQKVPFWQIRM